MSFSEILQGILSVFTPLIQGAGLTLKMFFDMPEIAGISIGYWLLAFLSLSIIFGGFFD